MKCRRGFTLIDSIVSFFLLGMALMVVLQLFPGAILATRQAEFESQANLMATQALEETRARGFSKVPMTPQSLPDRTLDGVVLHGQVGGYLVSGRNSQYLKGIRARVWWDFRGQRRELVREVWINNVRT